MHRSTGLIIIALLALLQGVLGLLRSFNLFRAGVDLAGEGLFFIPLVGLITIGRGAIMAGIAVLYFIFAIGAFAQKSWAVTVGIVAAILNVLFVLGLVLADAPVVPVLLWSIVPIIILCYFFLPQGKPDRES